MSNFVKDVIDLSIKHKMPHIPSALSMEYLDEILKYIDKDWNISIGKPHGAQAYFVLFEKYFGVKPKEYNSVLSNESYDFVEYSDFMLGNALGISIGLSYNNKKTWCNISDASLQSGSTLEAIEFIGENRNDILLTVDFNGIQLTKNLSLSILDYEDIFEAFGWHTLVIFDKADYLSIENFMNKRGPKAILFCTKKGNGVKEMLENPKEWHYKTLKGEDEITYI